MKNTTLVLVIAVLFISSCKSRQYSRNNEQIEKAANKENPNFATYTTLTYIDAFKAVAAFSGIYLH